MKDSNEVLLPSGNGIFIALRVEDPRGCISFTLFGDLLLDCDDGSMVEAWVSRLRSVRMARLTHIVSCPIAPSTNWLSSSGRFPFNPLLRALHTSAQDSPSST